VSNVPPSGRESPRRLERQSGFKGALGFCWRGLRQAVTADQFGRLPPVVQMVAAVVSILAFWFAWKLLDSVFTIHWLFSALLALVASCLVLRIVQRLFRNDSK